MTSTSITTRLNIESSPYESIFTLIDTRSNISDPRDPVGNGARKFVYDVDPLELGLGFEHMPYIVFELPQQIDFSNESVDGTTKFITWKHRIIVRQSRDGSSKYSHDTGRTDSLSIGNNLQSFFNSMSIRQQLRNLKIENIRFKKISFEMQVLEQEYVYTNVYELTYKNRLTTGVW